MVHWYVAAQILPGSVIEGDSGSLCSVTNDKSNDSEKEVLDVVQITD